MPASSCSSVCRIGGVTRDAPRCSLWQGRERRGSGMTVGIFSIAVLILRHLEEFAVLGQRGPV